MSLEVKKKVFFHLGFPKTGTSLLQDYLFSKHSQINYVSGPADVKNNFMMHPSFKGSIWRMNDKEFYNSYNELLSKLNTISSNLDSNKCNILSNELFLQRFFIKEREYDPFKGLLRLISLFKKSNVDLRIFLVIRNHSDIIPSFFYQNLTNIELEKFLLTANEIIKYFQTGKNNNTKVSKIAFDNFNYCRLYKYLSTYLKSDKLKIFLYECLKYDKEKFFSDLSNYLEIEKTETRKILHNKKAHITVDKMEFNKLNYLIYKNLQQPKNLFKNFFPKLNSFVKFLFVERNKETYRKSKQKMKNEGYKKIKQNSQLIKKYYRDDCFELEKKLHLGMDQFNYF